ncbi:uncharacterized protein LOC131255461 [Magnolia sinica]|uniref:uncharacterized protein LOC131255461 n=1 Tax=Magnolia sinica TaxID=86752 RepID=UPI00265A1A67|nr:uncharacterized protein LOC131255461 [Magnolia sinica]
MSCQCQVFTVPIIYWFCNNLSCSEVNFLNEIFVIYHLTEFGYWILAAFQSWLFRTLNSEESLKKEYGVPVLVGYSRNAPPKDYSLKPKKLIHMFDAFSSISILASLLGNGILPEIQVFSYRKPRNGFGG